MAFNDGHGPILSFNNMNDKACVKTAKSVTLVS